MTIGRLFFLIVFGVAAFLVGGTGIIAVSCTRAKLEREFAASCDQEKQHIMDECVTLVAKTFENTASRCTTDALKHDPVQLKHVIGIEIENTQHQKAAEQQLASIATKASLAERRVPVVPPGVSAPDLELELSYTYREPLAVDVGNKCEFRPLAISLTKKREVPRTWPVFLGVIHERFAEIMPLYIANHSHEKSIREARDANTYAFLRDGLPTNRVAARVIGEQILRIMDSDTPQAFAIFDWAVAGAVSLMGVSVGERAAAVSMLSEMYEAEKMDHDAYAKTVLADAGGYNYAAKNEFVKGFLLRRLLEVETEKRFARLARIRFWTVRFAFALNMPNVSEWVGETAEVVNAAKLPDWYRLELAKMADPSELSKQ